MLAGFVYLLPVLLLLLVLALRRYPGERTLVALASRGRTHHWSSRTARGAARRPKLAPRARVPRGGLLIAAALAVRPPPLLAGAPS
jgi:hypothetical protein